MFKSVIRIWLHFGTTGRIEFPFQAPRFRNNLIHKHTNVATTKTVPAPRHRNYLLTLTMRKTRQARANNAPRTMIAIVVKPRSSSSSSMGPPVMGPPVMGPPGSSVKEDFGSFSCLIFELSLLLIFFNLLKWRSFHTCAVAIAGTVNAGRFSLLRRSRGSAEERRADLGLTRFAQICFTDNCKSM